MNKLFSLALASLASIAFFSCSDDKDSGKSHADFCANADELRDCLIGKWDLQEIEKWDRCGGTLELKADGKFVMSGSGGCPPYDSYIDETVQGNWSLSGSEITTECTDQCDPSPRKGTVYVSKDGNDMTITATDGNIGVTSQFENGPGANQVKNPKEVYKYKP